jgi:hypothetical protein
MSKKNIIAVIFLAAILVGALVLRAKINKVNELIEINQTVEQQLSNQIPKTPMPLPGQ